MKVVQITAASVDDDDNWMSGHSHPIKRLRRQAITPTSAFLVCLLLLLASSAFDLAESAATGAGSSSCGSTGETESNGVAIVGGGSPQRESRSAQEAESLAAAQRSLLRMLPKSEKPRVSPPLVTGNV